MALQWHELIPSLDVQGDKPIACQAAGISLAVFRIDGIVYAVEDLCPHMGVPLHNGRIINKKLVCTWHHWEFDVAADQCYAVAESRCAQYPLREEDGLLLVGIDLEKLPIAPGGFPRSGLEKSGP